MAFEILVIRLLKVIAEMLYLKGGRYSPLAEDWKSLMQDAQDYIEIPNQVIEDDQGGHW